MPLITHLGLTQQSDYFGHAAPFHCFNGEYKGYKLAIVTNGKDRKFGCDNVRWKGFEAPPFLPLICSCTLYHRARNAPSSVVGFSEDRIN